MVFSGLLRRVALVRIDVSEEPGASFIRVTKIGELGWNTAMPEYEALTAAVMKVVIFRLAALCYAYLN
jgi:hypothetical protein